MTGRRIRRKGEPLLVFGMIMASWVGARVLIWQVEHGGAIASPLAEPSLFARATQTGSHRTGSVPGLVGVHDRSSLGAPALVLAPPPVLDPVGVAVDRPAVRPLAPPMVAAPPDAAPVAPGLAGGHAMLWLAVVGRLPTPAALLAAADRAAPPPALLQPEPPVFRPEASAPRRWSADAWALVRGGRGAGSFGPSIATYGASQVGAVLRYRLAPGNPHKPTAYLRASAALGGPGEREAAVGLSVRPVGSLPVVVAAEGRLGQFSGRTIARPAVMAITELAPITLPAKARAEFYLQGGYVGGRDATPFVDGQVKVDRRVTQVGPVELRAGAGIWGGAQQGAGRVDIGPSATLGVTQGVAAGRVAVDWRFRVAGAAEPASGPAVTISAGF